MLKQDAVPEQAPAVQTPVVQTPVVQTHDGQARVTPDELSRALAAIEARRQAEAAHLAGTIPIDQAVSDLHLDSTPGEIWAEVQTQRTKAAMPQKAAQAQYIVPSAGVNAPKTRRRRWRGFMAPVLAVSVLFGAGLLPHSFIPHFWNGHSSAASPLRSLAAIPNGAEVYADASALADLSAGKPLSQIGVHDSEGQNQWRLIKMGAHVYLRGYTAETDSVQQLQGKGLNVYNDDDSGELNGEHTFSVTLRVDKIPLQSSGGDSEYSEITVPNFQPDQFTTFSPWR